MSNETLLFLMLICRYPYAIRTLLKASEYATPRAQRLSEICGVDADNLWALKTTAKEKPYKLLILAMISTAVVLGYSLRIFEK